MRKTRALTPAEAALLARALDNLGLNACDDNDTRLMKRIERLQLLRLRVELDDAR